MIEYGFIFLDNGLRLRQFTERAAALLDLDDQDVGEPLVRLSPRLGGLQLDQDAQHVLAGHEVDEREVQSGDGRQIRVAYHPCLLSGGEGGRSAGVIITVARVTDASVSNAPPLPPRKQESGDYALNGPVGTGNGEYAASLKRRVEEQAQEIRRLNREVSLAERNERDRIARILHDEFQQILYALKMRIDAVLSGASIGVHGEAIRDLMEQATVLTRTLVGSLAPPIYESDDLLASLDWLADYVGDRFGVQVEVHYDEPLPTCNEERRVLLFEAVREFLFNVVKHAGTDRARVAVKGEADHITVMVEDQGQGFDAEMIEKDNPDGEHWNDELPEGGYGLVQIQRCLHLLGGRLTVESIPGSGTRASAVVPVDADGTLSPVS